MTQKGTIKAPELERDLTFDERATWGECPVCHASHGEYCHAEFGTHLGSQLKTGEGAHLGRLQSAPSKIKIIEIK